MKYLRFSKLLPWLVLASGLVVTYFAQHATFNTAIQIQQGNFSYHTREIMLRIEQRLGAYEQVLRGVKGLYIASEKVDRGEFRDYVSNLRLEHHFPGIQGIGFSLIIPPHEKARHIEAIRKEGFPGYTLHPEGERDIYTAIIFLEPFSGRNLRAFGYDMYSDAVRRAAMDRARDLDKPATSGKVTLVQEAGQQVQAGFLIYLPVYRNGSPHETLADRRANIIGWVYAPFRMNDLMAGVLGEQVSSLDYEVFDGENAASETLMYDNDNHFFQSPYQDNSLFRATQRIDLNGRAWTVTLRSLPVFEAGIDTERATATRLAGILVSILLALLTWQLAARTHALKQAQDRARELRESEAKSRAIIDAIPMPLALNDEQGNITYLNAAFMQTVGYTTADIPTQAEWWLLAYPDPQYRQCVTDQWRSNLEEAKRLNSAFSPLEVKIRCKDGSVRTFMARAASLIGGFTGNHLVMLNDVTERRAADGILRLHSNIFESLSEGINLIRASDGVIAFTNEPFNRIFGYAPGELIGKHVSILNAPSEKSPEATAAEIIGELERTRMWRGEIQNTRKDKTVFWSHINVTTFDHPQFGPIWVSVHEDISERKQAEQALLESSRQKDEFLAMLAHELRNPLVPIRNAAHIIGRLGLDEPRIKWAQELIEGQVSHLTRMVDDLLDVSRIARGKVMLKQETIEASALIEQVMLAARPLAERKGHQLDVRLPEHPVYLQGDPVRLYQVLFNLMDNAIKYTPEGGRIEFAARLAGQEIEISVRDNGMGITAALLPRIFDVFQQDERTLERAQGGLGIGLTLVKRLVEKHGGRVEAHSEGPGLGATFTVWLPAARVPALPAVPGAAAKSSPAAGVRVLVVDDDCNVSGSTAKLLELEGHTVCIADSGLAALEQIPAFRPQVVLLDIGLKGMDGFETAKRLRELPGGRNLCVVAVTGYGDEKTRTQALASGCDHFVAKPVTFEMLGDLLAKSVGRVPLPTSS